ncbi:hypothetical protein [Natrialba asiatica]|uniref:Uncharacterized protein n=1 Tax=Natrialba asiatica (strain ATCC 700177 / DSM 12278 / JCM 9576 / FERM P-10747 / NBRC 102637 / 172P1) TaxID=29540 RepID=M0AL38_NATA1|nr:hypothetical protein C481_19145 [Natrialba asiatica DSM 12278]
MPSESNRTGANGREAETELETDPEERAAVETEPNGDQRTTRRSIRRARESGRSQPPADARSRADGGRRGHRLISVLRLASLALLVVGFSGWLFDDSTRTLDSPFTLSFAVGIACALVAIYLGIFLADGDAGR